MRERRRERQRDNSHFLYNFIRLLFLHAPKIDFRRAIWKCDVSVKHKCGRGRSRDRENGLSKSLQRDIEQEGRVWDAN